MKSLGLKMMWVSLGPVLGVVGLAVLVMLTVWQRKLSAAIEQRRHLRAQRKELLQVHPQDIDQSLRALARA